MPRDGNGKIGMVDGPDNTFKFKCGVHDFQTNDAYVYEEHLRDKNLHHYQILNNTPCFYCGEMINAGMDEQIEYRHYIDGKATHKECRKKMYEELNEN